MDFKIYVKREQLEAVKEAVEKRAGKVSVEGVSKHFAHVVVHEPDHHGPANIFWMGYHMCKISNKINEDE